VNNLQYKSWIPEEVILAWEEEILPRARSLADGYIQQDILESWEISSDELRIEQLRNIQSYRNMDAIVKLPKLFGRFDMGKAPMELWEPNQYYRGFDLIWSIYAAFTGPFHLPEIMTPKEKTNWQSDIYDTAKKLSSLTMHSIYTDIPFNRNEYMHTLLLKILINNNVDLTTALQSDLDRFFSPVSAWQDLIGILYDVQLAAKGKYITDVLGNNHISQHEITLKKPNDIGSHRVYFAKYMTSFFGKATGKPKRKIVQALIECLFGEIDLRTLVKIAPWTSGSDFEGDLEFHNER
jgi:hypothetical protein